MNISGDQWQKELRSFHGFFRLHFADACNATEGEIPLAAHSVEKIKGGRERRIEASQCELKNCDVVAKLHARTLTVAHCFYLR